MSIIRDKSGKLWIGTDNGLGPGTHSFLDRTGIRADQVYAGHATFEIPVGDGARLDDFSPPPPALASGRLAGQHPARAVIGGEQGDLPLGDSPQ